MSIVPMANNSQEIPGLIFYEKSEKIRMECAINFQIMLGALRVTHDSMHITVSNW